MNTGLHLDATRLQRGQLQRITDGQGLRVLNLEGTLWLTQEGDLRDIVLEAGDTARIDHDGLTLLSALSDARFVLLHEQSAVPERARRVRASQAALAVH